MDECIVDWEHVQNRHYLEREVDEDLLQLLIDKIDAKLLKAKGAKRTSGVAIACQLLLQSYPLVSKISKP
jgi:hypothetical protein